MEEVERIPRPKDGFPFRSAVLAVIAVQSAFDLASAREFGGLISELVGQRPLADDIDYFGSLFNSAILAFCANTVLNQAGVIKQDPTASQVTLNNMETQVTLNVGREPGTWMPKEWGASGARLSLPLRIRFSDEVVDIGFPGEEALDPSGSRYAKKLYCEGGRFVGAQGETMVQASGGAWSTDASLIPGASKLNFFIDFPASAQRNDVTLPEGRVFFSCACWESRAALPNGITEGAIDMPNGNRAGVVEGPGGVYLLDQGGCVIKRNDWRNLWGSLGDVMLILGRFTLAEPVPEARVDETPQERAARERAEDAARGRY